MSKETIKVIQIDTDPAKKSIKDLRKELKEYKDQMANLDEDSDAFSNLAAEAGDLKHQIDEINERVKGSSSDWGDMVGNISKVAAGITGAFQAVAGGLQAMGVESEALDKTIARMQGLMAVTQGLSSIDGAIDGFNDLTAAMGAAGVKLKSFVTGLGKIAAPVAIVTALGVAFTKLKSAIDGTKSSLEAKAEAQSRFNSELQKELEIRKRAGYSEEELIVFEMEKLRLRQEELKKENELLEEQHEAAKREAEENARIASSMQGMAGNTDAAGAALGELLSVSGKYQAQIKENNKEIDESITKYKELEQQLEIIYKARELAAKRVKDLSVDPIVPSGTSTSTTPTTESDIVDQAYDLVRLQDEAIKRTAQIVKILDVEKLHTKLLEVQREEAAILELYGVVTDKSGKITQTYNKASQDALENNIKGLADLEKILELKQKQLAIEEQITKKIKEEIEAATPKSSEQKYDLTVKRLKEMYPEVKPEDYTNEMMDLAYREHLLYLEQLNQDLIYQEENVASLKQAYAELNEEFKKIGGEYMAFAMIDNYLNSILHTMKLFEESSLGISSVFSDMITVMQGSLKSVIAVINKEGVKSWKAYTTAGVGGLEAIGTLLNGLSDIVEVNSEESFEKQKGLQISATVMNMLAGIMAAWTSAMSLPPGFNIAYGAAVSAMIAGIGATQIAQIKNLQYGGDDSGSANPNPTALASTLIAPTQYSNAVQNASTEGAIKNAKVYVLESDITSTIGKVSVQETENRY